MNLTSIDWLIMALYFVFVLGIGVAVKRSMKTSTDFFLAGRAIPAWICGLAFISANLGAQEVIGMAASGAKYGIATSHFYWIGAIPAMVFVGVFMMPFYYGSRARLPIGLLFSVVGALLGAYGALSNKAIYQRSLGLNINFAWGVVLLLFGVTMLVLGYRGTKVRLPVGAASPGSAMDASTGDKPDAGSCR